ncbi:MAG: type VI secretion system lipoprotein TssJ [Pseudomonas sp.]
MPRMFCLPTVASLLLPVLLAACASSEPPPPPPTKVQLHYFASQELNPSPGGEAAPVRVRLFELKNTTAFTRADYFSLVGNAQSVLASDLVEQDEVLIKPGDYLEVERTLDDNTRQLGVIAGYRDLDDAIWRQVISVPAHQTTAIDVTLGKRALSVAPSPAP